MRHLHRRALSPVLFVLLAVLLLAMPCGIAQADEDEDSGPWSRLKRMDANGDGKITKDEFRGPDRIWNRFDADGDGVITKKEASEVRGRGGRGGMGGGMGGRGGSGMPGSGMPGRMGRGRGLSLEKLDTNKDGKISTAEWDAFFKKADENEDKILQKEEWDAAIGGRPMRDDAPKVGAAVPRVSAQLHGATLQVDLGAPKRTTVLIFGSWT